MKQKLKYRFDNFMSRGTGVLIGGLALVTLVMIVAISFVVWITDSAEGASFPHLLWLGIQRSLDPSLVCGDTGCILFVSSMFIIALGGVFIFSMLIGLLTNGISDKLTSLQKGHSRVVESNHTVILGWSNQVFTYLNELIEANGSHKDACVVIMSPLDKAEMDETIRHRIADAKTTRIVTRNGSPLDLDDLGLLSLQTAHSIIINEKDDASVIKVLLAVIRTPRACAKPYNIVAVLREPKNIEVARIVSRGQAVLLQEDTIISRIIAQTCRQSGLSAVYTELLNFEGNELYFRCFPELAGKTYGETLSLFETSAVVGLKSKEGIRLNPPMDTVLCAGDEVVAVTEDDDTLLLDGTCAAIDERAITARTALPAKTESILILGWNENAPRIIEELDHYATPGSSAMIVSNLPRARAEIPGIQPLTKCLKVSFAEQDVTSRQALDALLRTDYPHVILLSDRSQPDIQKADANTLVTLLHLRDISEKTGRRFSIVSEMLDVRNRKLAEVTRVDDFIVSETIISLLVTQISENNALNDIFEDIFNAGGSEIYMKPASDYVVPNLPVRFSTVVEAARRKGESAFGYKLASEEGQASPGSGIHVNPVKSALVSFEPGDCVIVAAEN